MPNLYDNITDTTRLGPALRHSPSAPDTVDIATRHIHLRRRASPADILDTCERRHREAQQQRDDPFHVGLRGGRAARVVTR